MTTEPKTHWTDEEGCDGDISLCTDRDGKHFVWLLLHSRSANGRASTAVHALSPELAEDIAAGLVQYAAKARLANTKCDYCDRIATRAEADPYAEDICNNPSLAHWCCDDPECIAKLENDLHESAMDI